MAARLNNRHQQMIRDKIQTSQLINRLQKYVDGEIELTTGQVRSIEILLNKSLPSLSSTELDASLSTDKTIDQYTDAELFAVINGGKT